jgi:translocation and assembly module TamA
LFDKPGIKIGNRLNHNKYEKLKSRFGTLAAAHGYFDAQFALSQIVVNVAEKAARITLVYNTGPRYKIGQIQLKHNILSEKFLQRYFTIAEGDDFDSDKLLELKNHFNASNYFAAATASPNLQSLDDGKVPIEIVLEERKRREYSIGAGAATDTGPRLLLGFEDRYINQRGHSLAADINVSEVKTSVEVAYKIPMHKPAQEFLKIYTGYEKEEIDTTRTVKDTYGASYSFLQKNKWLQTYALNYEQEDSIIGDQEEFSTDLIVPSVSFNRVQTDGNPYPLGGWSLMGRLSGSPQSLGSDYSYIQFEGRAKLIKSFDFGRILWRTDLGTTSTVDFDGLPASVRFFAGGDQSVRGYGYKSIGPIENDKVIGGKHLFATSLEYDYRLRDSDWVVAAFMDAGNAADELENVDFQRGAGLGIRWISPIGPIRLDLAKALDGDKGWRVHISMGPDL